MVTRGFRNTLRLFWLVPDKVFVSAVKEALVGFEGFTIGQRILIMLGYLSVFLMLGLTLAAEVLKPRLTHVAFSLGGDVKEIPLFVMIFSLLGFAAGWAFALTGATDCRRRIFIPIAGLSALQFLMFIPIGGRALFIVGYAFGLLLVTALIAAFLLTRGRGVWDRWPLAEYFIWLALFSFLAAMFWFAEQPQERARSLDGNFSILFLLTVVFWAVAGLAVVDLSVRVAHFVITSLRKVFPGEFLRVLTSALIVIRPVVTIFAVFVFGVALDIPSDSVLAGVIMLDFLFTAPLVLVMIGVAVIRKWNTRNALTVLGLSFATPVLAFGIAFALFGGRDVSDPLELALQGVGLVPDVLVFVGVMALSVLSAGASFAQRDGKYVPRSGRLLLGLGFALLVTTITFYGVNLRNVSDPGAIALDEFVDTLFMLSALFLGIPYLGWITWKRRDQLVGDEADFAEREPILGGLRRVTGPVWVLVALVATLVPSCCLCLIAVVVAGAAS